MADLSAGAQIPEVHVTPDKYLTNRYAGLRGTSTRSTSTRSSPKPSGCPVASSMACGRWHRSPAPRLRQRAVPRRSSGCRFSSVAWAYRSRRLSYRHRA